MGDGTAKDGTAGDGTAEDTAAANLVWGGRYSGRVTAIHLRRCLHIYQWS